MSKRKQEGLLAGVILLLIGVLFMLENFGIEIDVWELLGTFWPTILIAVGVKSIWLYYQQKDREDQRQE